MRQQESDWQWVSWDAAGIDAMTLVFDSQTDAMRLDD